MAYYDDVGTALQRFIDRSRINDEWLSWGVVQTYNPDTHMAKVALQPSGVQTDYLRVGTAALGHKHSVLPGTQCLVALTRGTPEAVICLFHSGADMVPADGISVEGNAWVNGQLTTGAVQYFTVKALPTAGATYRGMTLMLAPTEQGNSGTADALYVCLMSATGTYSWKLIVAG